MPVIRNIFFVMQLAFLLLASPQLLYAQTDDIEVEKVKEEADQLFEDGKYVEAYPLYSQLLSLNRKDPFYSYRFGTCMLYSDRRDPEKPIKYMELGVGELNGKDALMIFYHLGVAYHQAYRFGEAIRALTAFKMRITPKNPYYERTEIRLQMCNNGIVLLKDISDLIVLKKYEVGYSNFFRSYDLTRFGGNLAPKPDFLKSKLDRKSDEMQLVFFSDTHNVVYYSSLGDKKKAANKDIYRAYKMQDGTWTKPEKLSSVINTEFDEDFPYLLPDGKTLYFCSKGHNSMGGYDIFRTVYDSTQRNWTEPQNVDFAINTPFDDILFITDPSQRYAWFSSFRNSNDGRIMVYLVRIDKKIEDIEKLNTDMIAASEIDYDDPEYLKTLEKIRNKASLDVNSNEEIQMDDTNAVANQDNVRYNIPPNPTDEDIIDITFDHVNSAEQDMFNFRTLRDEALSLSDIKKRQAVADNEKSSDLYNQALNTADAEERKSLMAEAVEYSKSSEALMDESDVAMQMYNQYEEAASNQKGVMEKIQDRAGYIQQLAETKKLDTSVVLLKQLIDDIDTFKIEIVEAKKRIQADQDYVNDLQADVANTESQIANNEKQVDMLLQEAVQYDNEAALSSYDELKNQYEHASDSLRKEAEILQTEANELKDQLVEDKTTLNNLMNTAESRQSVNNDIVVAVENNDLADNNNSNNNSNANNANNTNNNSNNTSNDVNINSNNANNSNNTNTDNTNNNNTNDNNNNTNNNSNNNDNNTNNNTNDNNNNSNNLSNNDITNNSNDLAVDNHRDIVVNSINSKVDSLNNELNRQQKESDALALMYAQKNSLYNTRLNDWKEKQRSVGDNLTQQDIDDLNTLESITKDLYNQLDILSDLYSESLNKLQKTDVLITELSDLSAETSSFPATADSSLAYSQLDKGNDKIENLRNTEENTSSFDMMATDVQTAIKNEDDRLVELQNEKSNLDKEIAEIDAKIEKARSDKKKDKLRDSKLPLEVRNNDIMNQIAVLESNILELNDSLAAIKAKDQYYNEFSESVNNMTDEKLDDMSSSWDLVVDMGSDDVLGGPAKDLMIDLVAMNNNTSNTIDNNSNNSNNTDNNSNNNTNNDNNANNDNSNNNSNNDTNNNNTANVDNSDYNGSESWYDENTNINESGYSMTELSNYQDLIQSEYYNNGAESIMIRIASLKKLQKQNPDQADEIQQEIDALTVTMQAYMEESDAYVRNADNNLNLNNIDKPDTMQTIAPGAMASWHMNQYAKKLLKSDSLRQLALNTTDQNLKQQYNEQSQLYNDAARMHYVAANDIYGIWSNARYENNNVLIAENQDDGTWVMTDASQLMIQARRLRSEAFNENDFETKQNLLIQARQLELRALDMQEKALADAGVNSPEKMITIEASQLENDMAMNLSDLSNAYVNNRNMLDDYGNDVAINNNDNIYNNNNSNNDNTNNYANNNDNTNNNTNNNNTDNTNNDNTNTNNNNANNNNDNTSNTNDNNTNTNNNSNNASSKALYYRVQIAASRRSVETDQYFGNLDEVLEDFTAPWYRYMTGYFTSFNTAWAERNRVRPIGYPDAFVVAYYDGKRVPVYEARMLEQGGAVAEANANTNPLANNGNNAAATEDKYEMTDVNGLVYSVQVGVYATTRNTERLFGISPLVEEIMDNGYYRYYAGVYSNMNDATEARNQIRGAGVPDAFVVILYQGKKITRAEADRLNNEGVQFGGSLGKVSENLRPDRENATDNKPVFMVQIGAFDKDVAQAEIDALIASAGQDVSTYKDNDRTLYTVGSFSDYNSALTLKNGLADSFPDAFVVAFLKGEKIPVGDARNMIE